MCGVRDFEVECMVSGILRCNVWFEGCCGRMCCVRDFEVEYML